MKGVKGPVLLFFLLWAFWLLLNGTRSDEILAGGIVSAVIAAVFGSFFIGKAGKNYGKRFVYLLAYVPYYAWQEVLCVAGVTKLIITGRIDPAIVEVPHAHRSDWGITAISNSITMTPGTLTLEAKPGKAYVHWLHAKGDKRQIAGVFDRILAKVWD